MSDVYAENHQKDDTAALQQALKARLAELEKIKHGIKLSKCRFSADGLRRWLAVSAGGERRRSK